MTKAITRTINYVGNGLNIPSVKKEIQFVASGVLDKVTGQWVTVDKTNTVGNYGIEPRIGTEEEMYNTIYEDKRWRKFTVYFYGGFDGWDYYRTSRSNSDEFKYQKYRGEIDSVSGEGKNFSLIYDAEKYGLDKKICSGLKDFVENWDKIEKDCLSDQYKFDIKLK